MRLVIFILSCFTLIGFTGQDRSIVPGTGVGDLHVNKTSLRQVRKELGKGEVEELTWHAPHCSTSKKYSRLSYKEKGIAFFFYTEHLKSYSKVCKIELSKEYGTGTEKNIVPGRSTKDDVVKAYGPPEEKENEDHYSYSKIGISFYFENSDTLTTIYIFPKE